MSQLNYPVPANEELRLKALDAYDILDTIPEHEYDCIARIAAYICNTPVSLISLLDHNRQWFKSAQGFEITSTPREYSFCNYTILDGQSIFIVPDLRADERFANNPLVSGAPNAVFYAGAPLTTPDGLVMGSICVLDAQPRTLNQQQVETMMALAQQVVAQLELRKKIRELNETQTQLKNANKSLKNFAEVVSHDMKTPVANILLVNRSFKSRYGHVLDDSADEFIALIEDTAKELLEFIDEVLVNSHKEESSVCVELLDSHEIIKKIIFQAGQSGDMEIQIKGELPKIKMHKTPMLQVFQNLITNAVKYNDKSKGLITISAQRDSSFYHFSIADNGSGMDNKDLDLIFEEKQTLGKTDRFGHKGTGIGLSTVKNILDSFGGRISVTSEKAVGSVFKVSIPIS